MPSFKNNSMPEPLPRQEPSLSHNNEIHSNPYSDGGFVKKILSDLIRGPKLPNRVKPEVKKPPVKESDGIFDEEGRVSSRVFKKEVEAYDPHIDLPRETREEMAKEIIDYHAMVKTKDVKDYLKDMKKENPNPDVADKVKMREMKELLNKKMGKK